MEQACPTCVRGKLTQKPFPAKMQHELKTNQLLLAIDYVGPMQVTARDDYTGLLNSVIESFHLDMVYQLRNKNSHTQFDAIEDYLAKLKAYSPECRVPILEVEQCRGIHGE